MVPLNAGKADGLGFEIICKLVSYLLMTVLILNSCKRKHSKPMELRDVISKNGQSGA